jgi:hypothetical protein
MGEMDAFERQVADVARRVVGPPRPIDAIAIARATATRRAAPWPRPVLGALRFVAAGAVVALFGGLLLLGFAPAPRVEPALPGAAASGEPARSPEAELTSLASPAPDRSTRDDILPGVPIVTEEVEPGVFRVLSDGVRDLDWPGDYPRPFHTHVIAGPSGTVLLDGLEGWHQLGRGDVPEMVGRDDPTFGPDGSIWRIAEAENTRAGILERYEGESWTAVRKRAWAFAVAADGTIWVIWERPSTAGCDEVGPRGTCGLALGTIGGDWSGQRHPTAATLRRTLGDGGEGDLVTFPRAIGGLWATPRGVWLLKTHGAATLNRIDGDRIETWDVPGEIAAPAGGGSMGADGTFWAWVGDGTDSRLARFDGVSWAHFDASDGAPQRGDQDSRGQAGGGYLTVGPDGSVWVNAETLDDASGWHRCDGVNRFDGERVRRYLGGTCVYSVAFARDGSVWLTAVDRMRDGVYVHQLENDEFRLGLYVISTEAAMAR